MFSNPNLRHDARCGPAGRLPYSSDQAEEVTLTGATHRIEVSGARLHVETDGPSAAEPLLLWNGAACTTRMWDHVVPLLADRFGVIRLDVRGTGQSSPSTSPEGYHLAQYATDAIAVLRHFGHERSLVWSMAWGSRAAIVYAGLHPERITRLALYDASVHRPDIAAQAQGRKKALAAQRAKGIPLQPAPQGWNRHLDTNAMQEAMAAAGRFDNLDALLDNITAPTLIATGDCDPNLTSSRIIASRIAGSRLTVMENVGHGSILQRPDLTTRLFLDFVETQQSSAS